VLAGRNLARPAVDQGGQPEADRRHLRARGFAGLRHHVNDHVEQGALLQTRDGSLYAVVNA
jgi:hypothetical protein